MPVANATVAVYITGTVTLATIYSDNGVTTKPNPMSTDVLGGFDFYVANGVYDFSFSGFNVSSKTRNAVEISNMTQAAASDALTKVQSLQVVGAATLNGATTVATGQILSADQVVPINSAGLGGFFSPTIFPSFVDTSTGGVITSTGNQVTVVQIVLPFAATVGKIVSQISSTGTAGTLDIGIYSSAGNKLLNAGGVAIGGAQTGVVSASITPVFLPAGVYLVAHTYSNGTGASFWLANNPQANALLNQNGNRRGTAANAATAGVLPATLGTLTNAAINVPQVWFER